LAELKKKSQTRYANRWGT